MSAKNRLIGVSCVLVSAVLFSAKSVLVKLAYHYHIDSPTLLALRMAFALPFFLGLLFLNQDAAPRLGRRDWLGLLAAGLVGYYGASILDFWGMEFISASLERLILFMYPTLTVLLAALFLGTRVTRRTGVAILISYAGMALVFLGNRGEDSTHLVLGSTLVFAGALAYAGYLVGSSALIPRFGAARFTALALLIATAACFIHFMFSHPLSLLATLPRPVWLLSAALGFFCTFLPATLMTQGIRRIGAPDAALISAVSPVITLALGAWLLDESLSVQQYGGAVLVLGGVLLITYRPAKATLPAVE